MFSSIVGNIVMSIVCVVGSALAAGLTQGLISINPLEMGIKMRSGTDEEKRHAAKVSPIITNHHLLLVTLMLFNASANEALPLFLDSFVPPWLAIVLSVSIVLMFGEIIPSAVFTGPRQLEIASFLSPFVWCLIGVLFPIAYPISKVLDWWLGHDDGMTLFNRYEIAAMVNIQQEEGHKRGADSHDIVQHDEVNIIQGALRMRDTCVNSIMTESIFMLSSNERLTLKTLSQIFNSGYSRIPIYDVSENNITGLLLVKDLLFIDPDDEILIANFMTLFGRPIQYVWPDDKLQDVLMMFKRTHCHMAVVRDVNNSGEGDPFYEIKGIVTMEDIIEKILGTEILDETDLEDDNNRIKRLNRHVDFAQLRHMASQLNREEKLSPEEKKAVVAFLQNNVPSLTQLLGGNSVEVITKIVDDSQILTFKASTNGNGGGPMNSSHQESMGQAPYHRLANLHQSSSSSATTSSSSSSSSLLSREEYLYKKGKVANACTLILSGRVTVLAGKEQFAVEMGPWSILGAGVFMEEDGMYIPDFSARVISDDFRCLRIMKPMLNNDNHHHGHHLTVTSLSHKSSSSSDKVSSVNQRPLDSISPANNNAPSLHHNPTFTSGGGTNSHMHHMDIENGKGYGLIAPLDDLI